MFYEHRFGGKTYICTPEQEINYLYRKRWKEPGYKKDATLEYRMKYLDKKGRQFSEFFGLCLLKRCHSCHHFPRLKEDFRKEEYHEIQHEGPGGRQASQSDG